MLGYCWCRHSPKTSDSPGSCWETAAAVGTGLGCGPRLGRVGAIHPRAKAALLQEPDSSPLVGLFAVGVQPAAQRRSVELPPLKPNWSQVPLVFRWGWTSCGSAALWPPNPTPTARNSHFPVLGSSCASARAISSQNKTCRGGLWGSVSLGSHSTQC